MGSEAESSSHWTGRTLHIEQLAGELHKLCRSRYGLRPARLREGDFPVLLGLACLRTYASIDAALPPAPADALVNTLRDLIGDQPPSERQALEILFMLDPAYHDSTIELRDRDAAPSYGVGYQTWRQHRRPELIGLLAGQLHDLERRALARGYQDLERAGLETQRPPSPSAGLDQVWYERYIYYYRLWTHAGALRNEISAYLEVRAESGTARDYFENSLHDFTHCLYLVHQFLQHHGGLWLLRGSNDADVDEARLTDAIYYLSYPDPFSRQEEDRLLHAFLRTNYRDPASGIPIPLVEPFIYLLEEGQAGRELLTKWHLWLDHCTCEASTPNPGACTVHHRMVACDTIQELIDTHWQAIAGWYRQEPTTSPARLTPSELYAHYWGDTTPPWVSYNFTVPDTRQEARELYTQAKGDN